VQEVGFPTRNEVEGGRRPVCTSAARKIGVPLAGARDGVPQQARFPWLCAERMNAFREGVAGRNGPLKRDGRRRLGHRLEAWRQLLLTATIEMYTSLLV
jgi:hypothetical protein